MEAPFHCIFLKFPLLEISWYFHILHSISSSDVFVEKNAL